MKKMIIIISLFSLNFLNAQVPPLEDYTWKLEKIVTTDSLLVVPSNIVFEAVFIDDFFEFGNCLPLSGLAIFNDSSQDFDIEETELVTPISPCPNKPILLDIEFFFQDNYIFSNSNQTTTHEPFSYTFTTTADKIFLDITNDEGSVATFYNNFLNQDEFLNQQLKIYPNPVKDRLFIESPSLAIKKTQIYDLNGKVILEYDSSDNNSLDLSQLERGIYILKIETSNAQINKKIIKE